MIARNESGRPTEVSTPATGTGGESTPTATGQYRHTLPRGATPWDVVQVVDVGALLDFIRSAESDGPRCVCGSDEGLVRGVCIGCRESRAHTAHWRCGLAKGGH